jgi:hypothetical protein
MRHSHEYWTEFDYKLRVPASPRIFLIWKQYGEEVEKALCLVNDKFQNHVRVTNSL